MVCWTGEQATDMQVQQEPPPNQQRAKKCKLWADETDQQQRQVPIENPCPALLQPFNHQVGGHTQFLQLDKSTVCKPLIPRELSFYLNAPTEIRTFTPQYKGVIQTWNQEGRQYLRRFAADEVGVAAVDVAQLPSSSHHHRHDAPLRISLGGHEAISHHPAHTFTDGSSQFFLMLENVASKFERPCVLDLKMGTRQHGDDATAEKRNRQMAKCAASTSASLGVRLCGMQVYQATSNSFWSQDKYFGRRLDACGLRRALVQFFASGGVRSGSIIEAIIKRLKLLREAVEQQETFRFYSSSLLIVYEGCEESSESSLIQDFHFLGPVCRRSNSDCQLRMGDQMTTSLGYQPARSSSDAQILTSQRNKNGKKKVQSSTSASTTLDLLDLDSLSIDYLTDTDTQQSLISTSPQSVDSGLECLMETNSSSCSSGSSLGGAVRTFNKRLLRASGGYECDNSTDSTDSGVFSGRLVKKRSVSSTTDSEDSESDVDLVRPLHFMAAGQPGEEDGELTPVLEVSRTEEFSDSQMKKRRLMKQEEEEEEDEVEDEHQVDDVDCWSDHVDVRMIDFAHTTFSGYLGLDETVHWGPDNGYLLGLDSLTGILNELRSCCVSC